jgi:hypothetical protein
MENTKTALALTEAEERQKLFTILQAKVLKSYGGFLRDIPDEGSKTLAALLEQCFHTLNAYGKTPDQLKNIIKTFGFVLGDYPLAAIKKAFVEHLRTEKDFPTPSHIISIMRRDFDIRSYIAVKYKIEGNQI